MKMVKSLLLGTAAGLVAITGAQAADLPVKAKPVQYVKICSLYGAGFYYIPGTDTCLKIGGWVRTYASYGSNGSNTNGGLTDNLNTRGTDNMDWRERGYITADARNQTEYGTVRAYLDVGFNGDYSRTTPANSAMGFSSNRAFVQFAGLTVGVSQSFYDFYSGPATAYFGGGRINPSEDTGDAGQMVIAYTAQFGNGFSATLSAENPEANRSLGVFNGTSVSSSGAVSTASLGVTGAPTDSAENIQWPDVVANLRIDQSWGSAQIMGAVHDASGLYYGATTATGHPSNAVGWALGAGIKLLAPMIGPGDYFQAEVNYAEGASGYVVAGGQARWDKWQGNSYGFGVTTDGVYGVVGGVGQDVQLTTAWGVNAAYEHFWNKSWQTSVYGGYVAFSYNDTATAILCGAAQNSGAYGSITGGCGSGDMNFQHWNIGTRTQWNVDASTYLGVEVVYEKLQTALGGKSATFGSAQQPVVLRTFDDQDNWTVQARIHRNFYP